MVKLLDAWAFSPHFFPVLGLVEIILVVVVLFFLGIGGYYLYTSLAGPRKIEEIEKLLSQGKYAVVVEETSKLLENDERNLRARFALAQAQYKLGRFGPAAVELRQCVKIGRFGPEVKEKDVRLLLARCLLEAKNLNEAKNELLILTQLDPKNDEPHFELGRLFFRAGVHAKAVGYLQRATALNERNVEAFNLLGQAHYHLAAYADARAALLKATQLKPDLHVAHYFMGLVLRYLQDNEWAVKEFEKAERDESIRVKAILGKGMVYIDMEAYPKAITELDRGLKYAADGGDNEVNMRYLLALAAEKSRDMHTAIQNWEAVESIRPGFRDVKAKLKQYAEFRVDDSIKDFMIASNAQFEAICARLLTHMHMQILSLRILNDSVVTAITMEEDTGRRVMRKQQTLVRINRDNMTPISENQVREFHEAMKADNLTRGIFMTTGEITPAAISYASSRPIELYDTAKLAEQVRAVMKSTGAGPVAAAPAPEKDG